jgi:hypothetical protein
MVGTFVFEKCLQMILELLERCGRFSKIAAVSEHRRALVVSAYSYSGVASDLETETINLTSASQSYEDGGKSELLIFLSGVSSYSGQCGSQTGQDPVRPMTDVVDAALSVQHVALLRGPLYSFVPPSFTFTN